MRFLDRFLAPPSPCSYLPDQTARLEYVQVAELRPDEYAALLLRGWRRFGRNLFRPRCQGCAACLSLRVDARRFRPDRSQRRAVRANAADVRLTIGPPAVSQSRLDLYDRFHAERSATLGWPRHPTNDADGYFDSFIANPFPTEEWTYRLDGALVGVGYVDPLPVGLSAIYFFHDPRLASRSLGTFHVLRLLDEANHRGLPHVYLGYYVAGCRSLAYKARFRPHEILTPSGHWQSPDP